MFNIKKSETYSWDAANNISREQVEEFIKLLQYQLNLDVVKPIVVERKLDLPFEIADKTTEKLLKWNEAVEYVKTLGDGWRLPTIEELRHIYTSDNDFTKDVYWSNTPLNDTKSWFQNFYNGSQAYNDKTFNGYVRAVRDIVEQKTTLPFVVADKTSERIMKWDEAQDYIKKIGGNWRLPTIEELHLIFAYDNDFDSGTYWSGTEFDVDNVWTLCFRKDKCYMEKDNKNYQRFTRAVRDI